MRGEQPAERATDDQRTTRHAVLELAAELATERTAATAAYQKIERDQQKQQRILEAPGGPEEAFGREDVAGVEHEENDRERARSGEQAEHEQQSTERLGQPDDDDPEQTRLVADVCEDGGEPFEPGAAEPAEQLLASMRNEDQAEADAQCRLYAGREPLVDRA